MAYATVMLIAAAVFVARQAGRLLFRLTRRHPMSILSVVAAGAFVAGVTAALHSPQQRNEPPQTAVTTARTA